MVHAKRPAGPPPVRLRVGELATPVQFPRLVRHSADLVDQPRGQGEPVTVIPGFGASDRSTEFLRRYLRFLGYRVAGWGFGTNRGNVHSLVPQVITKVLRRTERLGQPVALVGWSLGGVIAREVARERPDIARQVITFGTPVVGGPKYTAAAGYYEKRGVDLDAFEQEVAARDEVLISAPITAIYTKDDGVVSWEACLDRVHPQTEHIEVTGTHIGLGVNPDVWRIVARRLATPAARA